ncbi:MAG: HisA/HisF-related TIM barrel protein [Ornithinimicrobium sp.]
MLLPAVDVAAGRAAQVLKGSPDDPASVAQAWVDAGAQMLHVVDLDAAYRRGDNGALLADLIASMPIPVQLSGGIDTYAGAVAALATGAHRINLASSALLDLDLVRSLVAEHGSGIVVGIDIRPRGESREGAADAEMTSTNPSGGDHVIARGSNVPIGPATEVIASLAGAGVGAVLVADASRDGSRRGVDLAMFARVADLIRHHLGVVDVVASGGVATLTDLEGLRTLAPKGIAAVVLGSALHSGVFTVRQAQAVFDAPSPT